MPIRDPVTRKPLSGAALKRLRAARAATLALPPAAAAAPTTPPIGKGIDAGILWASTVQAYAASLSRQGHDFERIRVVTYLSTCLGKLRHLAQESEQAIKVLSYYRGVQIDPHVDTPPAQQVGHACWAWWQIAKLIYEALTQPIDEKLIQHRAKALVAVGSVFPSAEVDRLTAEIDNATGTLCLPAA